MFLRKYLVIGLMLTLAACNTTADKDNEEMSTNASNAQIQELEAKVGDRVFFEFNKSTLTPEAQEVLKKQTQFMTENPELKFTIEGHCDNRGTREYNLGLGERRANAVKEFLLSHGVSQDRLTVVSYGKERPAVLGNTEWAWNQNRRGVTTIK